MDYTGLMLDVDGTLIPYEYQALPSDKVVKAVAKAQEKLNVSIVTGRSLASVRPVLQRLQLTEGFAVVNNGAAVLNVATEEVLYERFIDPEELSSIISYFQNQKIPFFLKQSLLDSKESLHFFRQGEKVDKGSMLFTNEIFTLDQAEEILEALSQYSQINAHKQHHRTPGKFSISISHIQATKLHGIYEVAKRLDLDPKTFIGAGDSYNDFPLLMACGLKVAMGNAVPDLKAIADYVAPSVEEDGIADVIERFILNTK